VTDWDRIVREHGPLVYRTAWRILGHVADVEDVVQDVFLQIHQIHQVRPVRHWVGLLRRLAACRALDRLRSRKNTVPIHEVSLPSPHRGPEEEMVEQELRERLRALLAELPGREAEVFCMRYFEDLTYEQIAEALNIRCGAVASALHRARARLEVSLLEAVRGQ